jgi:signal transduction histidine kinase
VRPDFSPLNRLFNTTSFRLAALHALILIGAFTLTGLLTWTSTREAERRELRERISIESASLAHEFEVEGLEPTILAIRSRARQDGAHRYRLTDETGALRAGDLPPAPPGWERQRLGGSRLLTYTISLPNGGTLSVGDDVTRDDHRRDILFGHFLLVGGGALLLGLAASVFFTRRALRRIDALIAASREVSAGHLDARPPGPPPRGGDDLDELTAAFVEMLDRVESLIFSVRQVSTDVAHDLRTPLSHVRQLLEAARDDRADISKRMAAIETADDRLIDVLRTFDAMLRLAELESGALTQSGIVNLGEIVDRMVDAFRPDIEAGGRKIEAYIQPSVVSADKDLLAQAVANLIENAARHTPQGSTITVTVAGDASGAVLMVQDNGPGIPDTEREAVLRRFYRLERSRSSAGTGLGLSIVAAIAKMHGARLSLEDAAPGLRATIRF